jgi:hypothetical protein
VRHLLGDDPQAIGKNGLGDIALFMGTWLHRYLARASEKNLDLKTRGGPKGSF